MLIPSIVLLILYLRKSVDDGLYFSEYIIIRIAFLCSSNNILHNKERKIFSDMENTSSVYT